jgi:hypothetical protein
MALRHQHHQPLLDRHQRLHGGVGRRPEHQREIDAVIHEIGNRIDVIQHPHVEIDLGVALTEIRDHARQEIERQRLAAGDAHGAAAQAAQVLDVGAGALQVGTLLAYIAHEHLAGGGQPHAARLALEQRRAEFLL